MFFFSARRKAHPSGVGNLLWRTGRGSEKAGCRFLCSTGVVLQLENNMFVEKNKIATGERRVLVSLMVLSSSYLSLAPRPLGKDD